MLKSIVYVAAGGALGAVSRYLVSLGTLKWMSEGFPWGTLTVNILGSLFVGFLWGVQGQSAGSQRFQAFFFVGLLGAFTTFSSYALDTLNYAQDGRWALAFGNAMLNNVGAFIAAAAGFATARLLFNHAD